MSRVFGLLNALAWALALAIAWTERRDPTRPQATTEPEATAPPASPNGPSVTDPPADPAREGGPLPTDAVSLATLIVPPQPPADAASPAPAGDPPPASEPPPSTEASPPTAAAPIADRPVPGGPIVGTDAPIRVRSSEGRPVPAGAVAGDGTATCPPDHPIKGNVNSLIYHRPGQASYERTIPEFCFASEAAAEAAGYRAPRG